MAPNSVQGAVMPSDPQYTVLLRAVVRRLNSFALIHLGANSVIPHTAGFATARKLFFFM